MAGRPKMSQAQEYDMLQSELAQSRKYLFERPLVITGVGIAALSTTIDAQNTTIWTIWPTLFAGLLMFNYWFSVTQMLGSCRIVAYIHLVLEGDFRWRGWETSLRDFRIWQEENRKTGMKTVEEGLGGNVTPRALMFYFGPIHVMHVVLMLLCLGVGGLFTFREPNLTNLVAALLLLATFVVFCCVSWKYRPHYMERNIERERLMWIQVLG
jgi:hypothetical protein